MKTDRLEQTRKEISKIQKLINSLKKKSIECANHRKLLKSQLREIESKCEANSKNTSFYLVELNRIKMSLQVNTEYNRLYAEQMSYLKMAKRANDRLTILLKNVQ